MNWARLKRFRSRRAACRARRWRVLLAAVGSRLSSSAVRSVELLLRKPELAARRRAPPRTVQQRWGIRKSDVLMLATSAPVRASLGKPGADTAPAYARRAFATMSGIASVALRDPAGRVVWSLPQPRVDPASDPRRAELGLNEPSGRCCERRSPTTSAIQSARSRRTFVSMP